VLKENIVDRLFDITCARVTEGVIDHWALCSELSESYRESRSFEVLELRSTVTCKQCLMELIDARDFWEKGCGVPPEWLTALGYQGCPDSGQVTITIDHAHEPITHLFSRKAVENSLHQLRLGNENEMLSARASHILTGIDQKPLDVSRLTWEDIDYLIQLGLFGEVRYL